MDTQIAPGQGSYLAPSFEHASVRDAMHPRVAACPPDAPAVDVARLMATRHIHAVIVAGVEHGSPGGERLHWAIASDFDLLRASAAGLDAMTAADIARTGAITIAPDAPLAQAAARMIDAGVTHLVVAQEGRPVGVLSTLDIAGVLAWGRG
jgi:CBS domain-containing protein